MAIDPRIPTMPGRGEGDSRLSAAITPQRRQITSPLKYSDLSVWYLMAPYCTTLWHLVAPCDCYRVRIHPPTPRPSTASLIPVSFLVVQAQTDWRVMYENLPQKASTYRGRILMSREIRDELPLGKEEVSAVRLGSAWRSSVRLVSARFGSGQQFGFDSIDSNYSVQYDSVSLHQEQEWSRVVSSLRLPSRIFTLRCSFSLCLPLSRFARPFCHPYAKKPTSQAVLSMMRLAHPLCDSLNTSRVVPSLGVTSNACLVRENPTCSVPALSGCEGLCSYLARHGHAWQ